jgi:hypothetical protein
MLSQKMCSRVSTFEVKATLAGDLNEWMTITLDDDHASTADVKAGVEQAKGIRPAMQELFQYDESWTGTVGSGGSGHSAAQEDAALIEVGFEFEGPCSLMVSVNESYAVVLEGQEEGEAQFGKMGVYERLEDIQRNGRGVWQALGGIGRFLYYYSNEEQWMVSSRESMEAGDGSGYVGAESTAATPDQVSEQWEVGDDSTGWQNVPKMRVRVCSSVEKHEAEQRVEEEQAQAISQAQQQLVLGGMGGDIPGVYELVKGKVVNGRAVWQHSGCEDTFVYYSNSNDWFVSQRVHMENDSAKFYMRIATAALTPDQALSSELWQVYDGTKMVEAAEVRFSTRKS